MIEKGLDGQRSFFVVLVTSSFYCRVNVQVPALTKPTAQSIKVPKKRKKEGLKDLDNLGGTMGVSM